MSDNEWKAVNGFRENEGNVINDDFDLLAKAKKYINLDRNVEESEKEKIKKDFLEALEKSSGLSTAYVLDYVVRMKNNCEDLEKVLFIKYGSEKSEKAEYDALLGDFVYENGESKKGKL